MQSVQHSVCRRFTLGAQSVSHSVYCHDHTLCWSVPHSVCSKSHITCAVSYILIMHIISTHSVCRQNTLLCTISTISCLGSITTLCVRPITSSVCIIRYTHFQFQTSCAVGLKFRVQIVSHSVCSQLITTLRVQSEAYFMCRQ